MMYLLIFFLIVSIALIVGGFIMAHKYEVYEIQTFAAWCMIVFGLIALIFSINQIKIENYIRENGYDIYTLRIYYIGGSTDVKTYKISSLDAPNICHYRGDYTLKAGDNSVPGVVRFEILSVKNVKE